MSINFLIVLILVFISTTYAFWYLFRGLVKPSIIFDTAILTFVSFLFGIRFVANNLYSSLYQGIGWGLGLYKLPLFLSDLSLQPYIQYLPMTMVVFIGIFYFLLRRVKLSFKILDKFLIIGMVTSLIFWLGLIFSGVTYGLNLSEVSMFQFLEGIIDTFPILPIKIISVLVMFIYFTYQNRSIELIDGKIFSLGGAILILLDIILIYTNFDYEPKVIDTFNYLQIILLLLLVVLFYLFFSIQESGQAYKLGGKRIISTDRLQLKDRRNEKTPGFAVSFSKAGNFRNNQELTWREKMRKNFNTIKRRIAR